MGFSRAGSRLEDSVHALAEPVARALGYRPHIIAYRGYGTGERVRILARVLLRRTAPPSTLTEPMQRARRGWREFLTIHAEDLPVRVQLGDALAVARTDRGGYIDVTIEGHGLGAGTHVAHLQALGAKVAAAPVQVIGDDARLGLVSDVDDTVLVTMLPRPLIAFVNSFVRHTSARKPVPHMAGMYRELTAAAGELPVFYLSTGAWNTAPVLERFLARHGFPAGPLLLTDWGPTNTGWFRSGAAHKRASLRELAAMFPDLTWVLIGDNGQKDPTLYAQFASAHRVAVIAIRELTATQQILAHGTPEEGDAETTAGHAPVVAGPDGEALLPGVLPALAPTVPRSRPAREILRRARHNGTEPIPDVEEHHDRARF